MPTNTPGLQTYKSAFPFEISLENLFAGEGLPVIYIVEKNKSTTDLQNINISIKPKTTHNYQLGGFDINHSIGSTTPTSFVAPPDSSFFPDQDNFNLAIAFRPGVIADHIIPKFSGYLQAALKDTLATLMADPLNNASDETNSCCVNGPVVRPSDNSLVWYCAIKDATYIPQSGLKIKLTNISANPGAGTRNTQVEFILGNVLMNPGTNPMTFSRSIHADIVNHAGVAAVPLTFTVYGLNTFLLSEEDATSSTTETQDLSLYCETIDKTPLQFGEKTNFKFHFSYYENSGDKNGFGTSSQVGNIDWKTAAATIYNEKNTQLPIPATGTAVPLPDFLNQYRIKPIKGTQLNGIQPFTLEFRTNKAPDTVTVPNPTYVSLEAEIATIEANISKSKAFYTAADSSPQALAQQHIATMVTEAKANLPAELPSDFITDYLPGAAAPYLPQLVTNMAVVPNIKAYADTNELPQYFNDFVENPNGGMQLLKNSELSTKTQSFEFDFHFKSLYNSSLNPSPTYNGTPLFSKNYYLDSAPNTTPRNDFFTSSADPTVAPDRWSDPDFKAFFDTYFYQIIKTIATGANTSIISEAWNGGEGESWGPVIIPSRVMYEMCYDIYEQYSTYLTDTVGYTFLLPITKSFTIDEWNTSYQKLTNICTTPEQLACLTGDNVSVNSQFSETNPWANSDFFDYVQSNLISGTSKAGLVAIQTEFLVPSASLYDLLFASYQQHLTSQYAKSLVHPLPFYVNPVSCMFNFKGLILSGHPGTVMLHIKVENVPGYWDTEFQVPIIISPSTLHSDLNIPNGGATIKDLVTAGSLKVSGPSTLTGDTKLEGQLSVAAETTLKGDVQLGGNFNMSDGYLSNNTNAGQHGLTPTAGAGGLSMGWNQSSGQAEVNFFNTFKAGASIAFQFLGYDKNATDPSKLWKALASITGAGRIQDKTGDVMPVGSIIAYGGSTAPSGWLKCEGQTIKATDYPDLCKALGGGTTSKIPNLAGRTVIGTGTPSTATQSDGTKPNAGSLNHSEGEWPLNYTGGQFLHELTEEEMPEHDHNLSISSYGSAAGIPGAYPNSGFTDGYLTSSAGSGQAHNNLQPYHALTYIIKH